MSILAREIRSARRAAARPSVREVCLLGISRPGPEWEAGGRVTLSGRVYQVEATGTSSSSRRGGEAVCHYVHLGAVVEGAES
jgi:hypothetical protein